jgi:hypothetical protein
MGENKKYSVEIGSDAMHNKCHKDWFRDLKLIGGQTYTQTAW